jgi:hypothetical protein
LYWYLVEARDAEAGARQFDAIAPGREVGDVVLAVGPRRE